MKDKIAEWAERLTNAADGADWRVVDDIRYEMIDILEKAAIPANLSPGGGSEEPDTTRESISRYLEHIGKVDIGAIRLGAVFTADEIPAVIASWIRNRVDEKWAAEVLMSSPPLKR